ncbi:hypothetical protein [Paenibacillus sp. GCM10028914]|uniref:hypothetical protein n=1 Tax=Paenibacillus sp. GCM10028914 TaxID=3273416 RepID=UPI003615E52D
MRTSAFIYGAIVGIAVYRMISSKGGMAFSSMVKGTDIGQLANTAKDMMKGYTNSSSSSNHSKPNQGGNRQESVRPSSSGPDSSSHSAENQHGGQTSTHSKTANLKQLKDFIRSNPDVKHEVEQILKETHTVIPGL